MNKLGKYNIAFTGLKDGEHEYDYVIKDDFFNHFEHAQVETGHIHLKLILVKSAAVLELKFGFDGFVEVECDRCLEPLKVPLTQESTLFVKFSDTHEVLSENVVAIPNGSGEINVAQHIYDYISLSLPMRKVHEEGECNAEVINVMNDLNVENEDKIDPRWDNLKTLINK